MGLTIPAEIVESVGKDEQELKIELAIFFYKKFNLSSGRVARFAGIPRIAFFHELGKRNLTINYDEEDARQDVETIRRFNEKFPMKKA